MSLPFYIEQCSVSSQKSGPISSCLYLFPIRLAQSDCRLAGFPRVTGYPCNGAVNLSHFGFGRQSVVLLCSVSNPLVD